MSAPRLDDVMCAFSCIKALTDNKENNKSVNVCAIFDNEEVGSTYTLKFLKVQQSREQILHFFMMYFQEFQCVWEKTVRIL